MTNDDLQNLLRTGIQAAQNGNRSTALAILRQVVEQDPDIELAWLWMASVSTSLDERRNCLERVLAINPGNARAKKALDRIKSAPAESPQSTSRPRVAPSHTPARSATSTPAPASVSSPYATIDREALLEPDSTSSAGRSFSRILFGIVGILATILIILGAYLVWTVSQDEDEPAPAVVVEPTRAATATAAVTVVPTVPRVIVDAGKPLPPTWTPVATWAPPTPGAPSPTPVLLDSYEILFAGMRGFDFVWNLYVMRGDGNQEEQLSIRSSVGDGEGFTLVDTYDPMISPDGSKIVFTARFVPDAETDVDAPDDDAPDAPFQEICVVSIQGGDVDCLTSYGVMGTGAPAWSPDGRRIAFQSDFDGDYDLYAVEADGGRPIALTRNDYEDREPCWSPDGTQLVYASDEGGPGFLEVWRMSADGADRKQLTDAANNSFSPSYSPDGAKIAFISDRFVDTDLFVMNGDGSGERILTTNDEGASDRDPSWSPDGRWIAFSSKPENDAFSVYLIHSDGSERQLIRAANGDSRFTSWLP